MSRTVIRGTCYPHAALMARNAVNIQRRMERGFGFEYARFDMLVSQYACRRMWEDAIRGGIVVC